MYEEVRSRDIFQAALSALGEWSAEGTGDNDIVGVFGKDRLSSSRDVSLGGGQVALELGKT